MMEFLPEAIEPNALPVLIIQGIVSIAGWFFIGGLYKRWRKTKKAIAKHLLVAFLLFSLGCSVISD